MALLLYTAKFDPFRSLDCVPALQPGAIKERKGSNFAIWQPWCLQGFHICGNLLLLPVFPGWEQGSAGQEPGGDVAEQHQERLRQAGKQLLHDWPYLMQIAEPIQGDYGGLTLQGGPSPGEPGLG